MSAFYDGQLSLDVEGRLSEHIAACEACAGEFAAFKTLSTMTKEIEFPQPSPGLWSEIQRTLDSDQRVQRTGKVGRPNRRLEAMPAIAASILIAIGISWFVFLGTQKHGDQGELAVNIAKYGEQFRKDPEKAQKNLLAKYGSRFADINEATRQLGYRPAVADALPKRYALNAMYVMDTPCCKSVQCLCKRNDGKLLAVFENDEDQPISFGNRPAIDTSCGGKPCRVVQMDGQLAVTWKQGARHITVVGAESLEDIQELVESLGQSDRSKVPGPSPRS